MVGIFATTAGPTIGRPFGLPQPLDQCGGHYGRRDAWVLWDGTYRIPGSPAYEPTLNSPVSMDGHRTVTVVPYLDMDTVVAPLGRCDSPHRARPQGG